MFFTRPADALALGRKPRETSSEASGSRARRYLEVRAFTESLCEPLETEDYVIQSMPEVSPTKWHLAHTTWFFETLLLAAVDSSYRPFDPGFRYLFNSYYNAIGAQFPRHRRGVLARPTVDEVRRYRRHVDERMVDLLEKNDAEHLGEMADVFELGLNHEQQHQELMLTDIKHVFSCNPLRPAYRPRPAPPLRNPLPLQWTEYDERLAHIGHDGAGFAFDNESPRHPVHVSPFRIASRLVTNEEYAQFIEDGGYQKPELWLSAGWDAVRTGGRSAPLYWENQGKERWEVMTLSGFHPLNPAEPVCHVSYFEADAYARWAGGRLPTEFEWEIVGREQAIEGNLADAGRFHPVPANPSNFTMVQMFGDVWEWTQSSYSPYPGFRPARGALAEYNGKFMCNQYVLRGGSCATPRSHIRATYRNFFPPDARWQFSGIRLAEDLK